MSKRKQAKDSSLEVRDPQSVEEKNAPEQLGERIPHFVESKDFIKVYSNHVFFLGTTRWDIRMAFGEMQGVRDNGQLVIENRVSVTMPIECAKVLLLGLQANLKSYERSTGISLNLPEIEMLELPLSAGLAKPQKEEPTEKK